MVTCLIIVPDTTFTSICVPKYVLVPVTLDGLENELVPLTLPELDRANVIVPGMAPAPGVNEKNAGFMFCCTDVVV